MNAKSNDLNDDLSDLLGGAAAQQPKALPQDEAFTRIRDAGIGLEPTAPVFKVACTKCNGRGRFISYAGRDVGQCFACKGKGHFERKTAPAQLARAKDRRVEAKNEVRETYKTQREWLTTKLQRADRLPEGYAKMLQDFLARLNNGQELSDGQLGVIAKGMARDAEYAAQRAAKTTERAQGAPVVDASKIVEALQKGKAAGLKWVTLRFNGIIMQEAKKHPGTIYVKAANVDRTYLGKIVDGRFIASRDCTPEQTAAIVLICEDPLAAAKVFGNLTGSCCVCGRELTNKESIESGIGPICSGRMGWTPGGIRIPVAEAL